jgi:hypothetical protein
MNKFNLGIAHAAILEESARHFNVHRDHENVETSEGSIYVDANFNVCVRLAREGGGYQKEGFLVVCATTLIDGCPAYHGTVSFIRKR